MARVAEPNGFWKTLALGLCGLVVLMLGWFLVYQVGRTDEVTDSVNNIERRIARIEERLDIRPVPQL